MAARLFWIVAGIGMIPVLALAQHDPGAEELPTAEPSEISEEIQAVPSPQDTIEEISEEALEPAAPETPEAEPPAVAEVPPAEEAELFPTTGIIEEQKAFWIRIFTEVRSNEGLLHDEDRCQPVYEKLEFGTLRLRAQRAIIRQRIAALQGRLRQLSAALESGGPIPPELQELLDRFPEGTTAERLRSAARNVRFQRGLADRFRDGLVLSGMYAEHIQAILSEHAVPADLMFLPHVESSFNHRTYSRAGAAGIWQFTRGTGKQYMRIGYEVDERLDPLLATRAAAALLAENHARLGTWPLAITAYNHGRQSLERIVAKTGTRDLAHLIEHYDGRLFKFASKNFYAEFLAAREVASDPARYFGDVDINPPLRFHHVELPFYADFKSTARLLGLDRDLLQELNPSLRPPVLQGMKYIPKGYTLRLPEHIEPSRFYEAVPAEHRFSAQKRTTEVIVLRGDTLYDLGRRYNVPWQQIALANNISAFRSIRPGQRLILPDGKALAAASRERSPAPAAPAAAAAIKAPRKAPAATAIAAVPEAPTASGGGAVPESIAFQRAEGASLFQDLDLHNLQSTEQRAEIVAAYGETIGHYADWSGATPETLRRLNGRGGLGVIRPGDRIVISLARASAEEFQQKRHEFHHGREEDFFAVYAVTELQKLVVKRGDTSWSIAQSNNVPMWLFYQHNPTLINSPLRAGMTVLLPVIEEVSDVQRSELPARSGQAG